ncbi:MAG: CocE/NonD family hydrolase [Alphaproteobacteria bacterium]|nr:CocE/NonD family hydrolase [Alphaproteobacteria bacterium]
MTIVTAFPRKVHELETVWIPMPDGVRLAARVWLPEDAERDPVPAILEYIPYRRRDGTRLGDDPMHAYWAGHGYACVRLDIRGSGDSEGILIDEYTKQEQDDAVAAIAWLAAQPWCNGSVGMTGISWGGFNCLQVAARRPPALKAIIPVAFTDDRYADDMHYMGGALLNDNLNWGTAFFAIMGRAPDPHVVGDGWRETWRARIDAVTPYFETWLRHPFRDGYWKHGSVCEDYGAIRCAVMAIGGWADGYSNAVFRVLANLACPRLGIVGPWGHTYPYDGIPGPAIGFLQEALRFWDHWLKGRATGIMDEPMLRAWVQHYVPPCSHHPERPGHWVAERAWPGPGVGASVLHLNHDGLAARAGAKRVLTACSPQTTGLAGGEWCAYGLGGQTPELPHDQREDDGKSLVFDAAPLDAPLEILGAPVVELTVAADRPVATVVVRLCDVAPDGTSLRVSFGVLNLTHRRGHARPRPLKPGKAERVRVQLNDCGHAFAPGHRVRLAVSTCYWPIVWPAPVAATLAIAAGASRLTLPARAPRPEDVAVAFPPPAMAAPGLSTRLTPRIAQRGVDQDLATGLTTYTVMRDEGTERIEAIGVDARFAKATRYSIDARDPLSARHANTMTLALGHDGWHPRIEARTVMTATASHFQIEADLEAFDGERRVFARSWTRSVPRKLV